MANVKATDLIDFTRASKGNALRKVSYGDELVENGTFDSDLSGWTAGSSWSWDDGKAYDGNTDGAPNTILSQSINVISGKTYAISFDVSGLSGGTPSVSWAGSSLVSITTDGSYEEYVVATASSHTLQFSGSNALYYIDNVSVKEVLFDQPGGSLQLFEHPDNIPRIEYDASGNLLGLLVEEARTNLIEYSTPDGTNWNLNAVTLAPDDAVSPDGTENAVRINETTVFSGHNIRANSTNVTLGLDYTLSAYVKADTSTACQLLFSTTGFGSSQYANFDLSTGTVGYEAANATATIQDVGNGWYRCAITSTATATTASNIGFIVFVDNNPTSSTRGPAYVGDTAQQMYIYGVQVEEGSFPTSHIKTTGSTASRSADVASIDVDQFGYNPNEGTLFVELQHFDPRTGSKIATGAGFGDGTTNNRMWYYQNKGQWIGASGGVTQFSMTGSEPSENTPTKFAGVFKTNDFTAYIDGTSIGTDSSGSVPIVTTLFIGYSGTNNSELNGHIKSLTYIPKRLSNAQLQDLTS